MTNAALKRHRITVQRICETIDEARQKVIDYYDVYVDEPAAYMQVAGGEQFRGRQIEPGVTAVFEVNYREGYTETDRIYFDGSYYGVTRINIPNGIKRYMLLFCSAVKDV